jgi:hypothetical protein
VEEQFRAAVVGTVAGDSSEIQRDIIAKTLGTSSDAEVVHRSVFIHRPRLGG